MLNICPGCGLYCVEKLIQPAESAGWAVAVCPHCNHGHPFRQLPLLTLGGASGTGKSTIAAALAARLDQVVLLDTDILWRPEFDQPETQYRDFFETWLRLAKNIGQAGRPVLLVGAGVGVPHHREPCQERRYLGPIHPLALVCDDSRLAERLRSRPAWRHSNDAFVAGQQAFNRWFQEAAAVERLDTTHNSSATTADQVVDWIDRTLQRSFRPATTPPPELPNSLWSPTR